MRSRERGTSSLQVLAVVSLAGIGGVGAMKFHGAVTGNAVKALVPEWEVEAPRAYSATECGGEPVEKQLARREFELPSGSVAGHGPLLVRPVSESRGSSMSVSLHVAGAAACPAGTSVTATRVKATLTFVGSRCAARALEAATAPAATAPVAGANRHPLWTGRREQGEFRLKSETFVSCADGSRHPASDLPASGRGKSDPATGMGGVGQALCQLVLACGIVVGVPCAVLSPDVPPIVGETIGNAAEVRKKKEEYERRFCDSQEGADEVEGAGDGLERVGNAVEAVVVGVAGGIMWVLTTGGQWVRGAAF